MVKTQATTPVSSRQRIGSIWTMAGTLILLTIAGVVTSGFSRAFSAVTSFVTLNAVRPESLGLSASSFGSLAAMTVISLPFAALAGVIVQKICGDARQEPTFFQDIVHAPLFAITVSTIIAEELFARLLFIGVGGYFWHGQIATYVLFLVGNGLWALVHLSNYRDPRDRQILRVLPQFVGGIFLTATFLQWGFFAALLVHLAYDMVLFSWDRRNIFGTAEIGAIILNIVWLVLGLVFVGKPLSDLTHWASFTGSFAISGWGFWNYFWAVLVIEGGLTIVGDLLAFDFEESEEVVDLPDRVLYSALMVVMLLGGYWLISLLTANVLDRLLVLAIALLFFSTSGSGSNLARMFWTGIPSMMFLLCTILAVDGFWAKVALMLILFLINIPEELIRSLRE